MEAIIAGLNFWNQLGPRGISGDVIVPSTPSFPLENLKSVSFGFYNTVCAYSDGTVYMSGRKSYENDRPIGQDFRFNDFTKLENIGVDVINIVSGDNYTVMHIASNILVFYGLFNEGIRISINLDYDPIFIKGCSDYFATIDCNGNAYLYSSKNIEGTGRKIQFSEPIIDFAVLSNWIFVLSIEGILYRSIKDMNTTVFTKVEELENIRFKQISGYCNHILALAENGDVYSCGHNKYGQLGNNTQHSDFDNFSKVLLNSKCKQVATGLFHSIFLTEDGKAFSCGFNFSGQLILGNCDYNYLVPHIISFNRPVSYIAAGCHACALIAGEIPTFNGLTANINSSRTNRTISIIDTASKAIRSILKVKPIMTLPHLYGMTFADQKVQILLEIQLCQYKYDLNACKKSLNSIAAENQRLKESQSIGQTNQNDALIKTD